MNYKKATIAQLHFIALEDECLAIYKYEALRELELRSFKESSLTDLILLRARGLSVEEISLELGYDEEIIRQQLIRYRIWQKKGVVS